MSNASSNVRVMELTRTDITEIHCAVRERAEILKKEATRLKNMGCYAEAGQLEGKVADLNDRLLEQFAVELDDNLRLPLDGKQPPEPPDGKSAAAGE